MLKISDSDGKLPYKNLIAQAPGKAFVWRKKNKFLFSEVLMQKKRERERERKFSVDVRSDLFSCCKNAKSANTRVWIGYKTEKEGF